MAETKENPHATPDSLLNVRTGVPGVKKGTTQALPIDPMPEGTTPFQAPETATRREALWLGLGWGAFGFAGVSSIGMLVSFLFPRAPFDPKQVFKAGYLDEYPKNTVSEKFKGDQTWLTNVEYQGRQMLYALSTVCTHLGCTPNWLEADKKFKCPCHGSGFYQTGINFEGPAPRPLERYKIFVGDDGQIVVDKTAKYQQEKGQWDNPDSYILV
jgi:cytochrome b6-f complex iron-sulfur subunit